MERAGPLSHLTVVEFAGLGPAPFAGMMLADQGARVIRIDRPARRSGKAEGMATLTARDSDVLSRGRESIALDLKQPEAREVALRLVERADILIEGFRPGVMESLGLGPDVCLQRRPSLVYGRVTGWGQNGPLAQAAGHDINYIALTGALHSTARRGQAPVPTPGLIGDFGGGGMLLAFGVMAAVSHAQATGEGQVVDAAITDGSALLTALIQGWHSCGLWNAEAGTNNGDGGAPFYDVYVCADGKYISIGSMEPQFYALLREKCGLTDPDFDAQWDAGRWPALKARVAEVFRQKTRQQWCELLEGTDVCFAPVLDLSEAAQHPHNEARGTFVRINGITQPAPAPRFSGTPSAPCRPVGVAGADMRNLLEELDFGGEVMERLLTSSEAGIPGLP
ncbi:CaiB/BaiF CoA transferase family protein [Cupriavidus sp. IDO]|uniref:CaiB/BaiF CoA transferase family protein n=1 Tax=Cupriavidus sp. IDO TaxID=1539142 RepID=UPI00068AC487|nr:CaiB/BaiF CoA-transferase family protein [Cupriavidus sp. IDO]KWR87816.1 carnitine dehydratase [Cupriavidus sp. IDO]